MKTSAVSGAPDNSTIGFLNLEEDGDSDDEDFEIPEDWDDATTSTDFEEDFTEERQDSSAEQKLLEAFGAGDIKRNGCLAHLLQLGIRDAMNATKQVAALKKKVTDIVSFFNRRPHYKHLLKQKTGGLVLIPAVCTRWDATYYCFNRILDERVSSYFVALAKQMTIAYVLLIMFQPKVQPHLNSLLTEENEMKSCRLTATDWKLLRAVSDILKPFSEMTNNLQGDGVTSSLVIPNLITLTKSKTIASV